MGIITHRGLGNDCSGRRKAQGAKTHSVRNDQKFFSQGRSLNQDVSLFVSLREDVPGPQDARVGSLSAPASLSVVSVNGFHKTNYSQLCEDNKYTSRLPCDAVDIVAAVSYLK